MCLSHSSVRSEACSVTLRGVGLAGKLSTAGMVETWKMDEQRAITERRGDSRVGSRNLGDVCGDWRHSQLIQRIMGNPRTGTRLPQWTEVATVGTGGPH